MMNRGIGIYVMAIGLVACRASTPSFGTAASHSDSAGVAIVYSEAPSGSTTLRVMQDSRVVVRGNDSLVLLHVLDAHRLPDGRLAILNGREPGILIAGTDGRVQRRMGRFGGGPGEFRAPQALAVRGDSLMVWDLNFGPRTVFDTTGRVLDVHSFDLARLQGVFGDSMTSERHLPVGVDGIVAVTRRAGVAPGASAGEGMWRQPGGLVFIPDSGSARSVGPAPGLVMYNVRKGLETVAVTPLLFVGASAAIDQGRGLVYVSDGLRRVVDLRDLNGSLTRSVRWGGQPERASEDEYDSMSALWLQQADARFGARSGMQLLDQLPDQHSYPPVLALIVGTDGRLWVRAGIRQWYVFGESGEWQARALLPFRTLYEAGADYVIGLMVDEDGVESVAEFRLEGS